MDTRLSFPADIPALRALWSLAFGDDGAYVDNFFTPITARTGCWYWRRRGRSAL